MAAPCCDLLRLSRAFFLFSVMGIVLICLSFFMTTWTGVTEESTSRAAFYVGVAICVVCAVVSLVLRQRWKAAQLRQLRAAGLHEDEIHRMESEHGDRLEEANYAVGETMSAEEIERHKQSEQALDSVWNPAYQPGYGQPVAYETYAYRPYVQPPAPVPGGPVPPASYTGSMDTPPTDAGAAASSASTSASASAAAAAAPVARETRAWDGSDAAVDAAPDERSGARTRAPASVHDAYADFDPRAAARGRAPAALEDAAVSVRTQPRVPRRQQQFGYATLGGDGDEDGGDDDDDDYDDAGRRVPAAQRGAVSQSASDDDGDDLRARGRQARSRGADRSGRTL